VTPENFLAVIKGDASAVASAGNGKVLKTNANSKVFINFADHGAPGLIAFPSSYLYADDFNTALNYMHDNAMYKEMVVYIEACESGSMFENILSDKLNIYATTAANSKESSWGTYCPPDDSVNGVHLGTCLGDLYSVNWMEDSDKNDATKETLAVQFQTVKTETA
jgi:legumain